MRRPAALVAGLWLAGALATAPLAGTGFGAPAPASAPSAAPAGSPGPESTVPPHGPDWGAPRDVAAIREIELGIEQQTVDPLASVTGVTVSRDYALAAWKTTQGSGQSLYCRTALGWNRIASSGARFDVVGLVGSGVPSDAVQFMKAHAPGGLDETSGMGATRFRKLTGRCL
jgi:hypothetical protein